MSSKEALSFEKIRDWHRCQISPDYAVSFKQIGSRIILISPEGNSTREHIQMMIEARNQFLEIIALDKEFFSEMRDFSHLTHYAQKGNLEYRKLLHDEKKRGKLISVYNYNVSVALYWMFFVLTPLIQKKVKFDFLRHYKDAEQNSVIDLYKRKIFSLEHKKVIPTREIFFEGERFAFKISMMTNIIIYCEIKGYFGRENLWQINLSLKRIIKYNKFDEGFYLILNFLPASELPEKNIKEMQKQLITLDKSTHCLGLYFIRNKKIINKTIQNIIYQLTINTKIYYSVPEAVRDTYNDKFSLTSLIREANIEDLSSPNRQELNTDIENLLNFINSAEYHLEEIDDINETIADSHHFKGIYNLLSSHAKNRADKKQEQTEQLRQLRFSNTMHILKYKSLEISCEFELSRYEKIKNMFKEAVPLLEASGAYYFEYMNSFFLCKTCWPEDYSLFENWKIPEILVKKISTHNHISFHEEIDIEKNMKPYYSSLFNRMNGFVFIPIFHQFKNGMECLYIYTFPEDSRIISFSRMIKKTCLEILDKSEKAFLKNMMRFDTNKKNDKTRKPIAPVNIKEAVYEFDSSKEFYLSVVKEFLKKGPAQLKAIYSAIQISDYKSAAKEAHKIKGGSANLFAEDLSNAASILEEKLKNEDINQIDEYMIALQREWERLCFFFKENYQL